MNHNALKTAVVEPIIDGMIILLLFHKFRFQQKIRHRKPSAAGHKAIGVYSFVIAPEMGADIIIANARLELIVPETIGCIDRILVEGPTLSFGISDHSR